MKKIINSWFTLIEVIVAVAILSIIMVSVFAWFSIAADINNKTDVSRVMQDNIKTALEIISEDIRLNDIKFQTPTDTEGHKITWAENTEESDTLYTWSSQYYLWTQASSGTWVYDQDCYDNTNRTTYFSCRLIKNDWTPLPITNSWVDFTNLSFYVSNETANNKWRPKVTINFDIRPALNKWIKSKIIEANKLKLQTTINSEYINNAE